MAASEERMAVLGHSVPYRQAISPLYLKGTRADQDTNNHDFQLDARGKTRMSIFIDNQPNKALTVSVYEASTISSSVGDADVKQIGSSHEIALQDNGVIHIDTGFPFYIIRCVYAVAPTDATAKYYTVYVNLTNAAGRVGLVDENGVDALGEVQASPTSYTVLDRLKTIATNITAIGSNIVSALGSVVLAAGSAVIGKVRLVTATGDEVTDDTADAIKSKLVDATGTDAIGEVQATPTSNTILARLKDLLTGIVLAAGTAIIGRVGHDKTGVANGRKVVAAAATAEALASSTSAKVVIITAETNNTGIVVVGGSGVIAALATRQGTPLNAGDSVTLEIDNLADVYLDVTVNGDGVTYTYLT